MAVNPVLGSTNIDYTQGVAKAKNQLDMQMFLTLLTTQLSNQNPLQPMDDASFFGQIAQLGTVQGMDNLTKSQQITEASALLGKTVTAVRPMTESGEATNSTVTGVVTGLTSRNGAYYLNLRQSNGGIVQVEISSIQQVQQPGTGSSSISAQ